MFADGREKMIDALVRYAPYNEQEEKDKTVILRCLKEQEDIFFRTNAIAHMTASAWAVNPKHDRVLMVYHKIYDSWSWTGGRRDGASGRITSTSRS